MAKEISPQRKEITLKKQHWDIKEEERTTERVNILVNKSHSLFEFLKFCFTVKAKIVTLPDVVLNLY